MKTIGHCQAILSKIATTLDGGARITLDLSASDRDLITHLLSYKLGGAELIYVSFTKDIGADDGHEIQKI